MFCRSILEANSYGAAPVNGFLLQAGNNGIQSYLLMLNLFELEMFGGVLC